MKGKLFNVIPLSGSAFNYWGFWDKGNGVKNARELASGVHCNYPDLSELGCSVCSGKKNNFKKSQKIFIF